MIESHVWTGWCERRPEGGVPIYGDCETVVKGAPCGRPRHQHEHPEAAHTVFEPGGYDLWAAAMRATRESEAMVDRLLQSTVEMPGTIAPPTRAGRAGDTQSLPEASDTPVMHALVQFDLQQRLQVGIERYGQPLQAYNGRNALRDAYEEVLDLAVYLRQAIWEQENPR